MNLSEILTSLERRLTAAEQTAKDYQDMMEYGLHQITGRQDFIEEVKNELNGFAQEFLRFAFSDSDANGPFAQCQRYMNFCPKAYIIEAAKDDREMHRFNAICERYNRLKNIVPPDSLQGEKNSDCIDSILILSDEQRIGYAAGLLEKAAELLDYFDRARNCDTVKIRRVWPFKSIKIKTNWSHLHIARACISDARDSLAPIRFRVAKGEAPKMMALNCDRLLEKANQLEITSQEIEALVKNA